MESRAVALDFPFFRANRCLPLALLRTAFLRSFFLRCSFFLRNFLRHVSTSTKKEKQTLQKRKPLHVFGSRSIKLSREKNTKSNSSSIIFNFSAFSSNFLTKLMNIAVFFLKWTDYTCVGEKRGFAIKTKTSRRFIERRIGFSDHPGRRRSRSFLLPCTDVSLWSAPCV